MEKSSRVAEQVKDIFSSHASLAAVGLEVRRRGIFRPVVEEVHIGQKTVKHTPVDKLQDALLALMAGARGMVEINSRVREDIALQRAFGRQGCAEQSVVQETLSACTAENVAQMQVAMQRIYRQYSQGYRHPFQRKWLILDGDLSGRPCGKQAEGAHKGYFGSQRNHRGRQMGYMLATDYQEVVVERLYPGQEQLSLALPELLQATAETLSLDVAKRRRTIVRLDAGGGSVQDVKYLLSQEYRFIGKDYSAARHRKLVRNIQTWFPDPHDAQREVAWVAEPCETLYGQPLQRVAVRCRKKNGQYAYGIILSNLSVEDVLALTAQSHKLASDPQAALLAYVYFYDQRGGGVETAIKEDKQGLGTGKRNKKSAAGQEMLLLLETLAHNILVWVRNWLRPLSPKIAAYGFLRLERDVLAIPGRVLLHHGRRILKITLNQQHTLAESLVPALAGLLARQQVALILGEI
jgi:hypothetical protein